MYTADQAQQIVDRSIPEKHIQQRNGLSMTLANIFP
jgi:hypothetical protein